MQGKWAYAKRLNTELGRKIAREIVLYASEKKADVIVFEYLEMKGKLSGKKKQKLQMWRKRDIQKRCGQQAHRKGIRISRICAWNTSRLAFDGSGEIARDTRIIVCVRFRLEKDTTVICQHRIISEQDILSVKF